MVPKRDAYDTIIRLFNRHLGKLAKEWGKISR
jgi:hypothetical protein